MRDFDSRFNPPNSCDLDADSASNFYTLLLLLTGLAVATYALARFAESNNRLNYESRFARVISGLLAVMMRMWHTRNGDLEIANTEKMLIAVGPHRTGWEAIAFASNMRKTPPRFFATNGFNSVPGVSSFMKMFKAIPVEANPTKRDNGRSSNASALDEASKTLNEGGCVVLFPQGNFSRLGQKPPRVYPGAAKLALSNKMPIHVIRLDGFWCLQNPIIPISIRNNVYYRAFLSAFHMNNIRATLCGVVDFHLQPENESLSDEAKIEEICAQLYAYYRPTQDLTAEQIDAIKAGISDKTHLLIWRNKVQQDTLGKQLLSLEKEGAALEETTLTSMRKN